MGKRKDHSIITLNLGYVDYLTKEYAYYRSSIVTEIFENAPSTADATSEEAVTEMAISASYYMANVVPDTEDCQERFVDLTNKSFSSVLSEISSALVRISLDHTIAWDHLLYELFLCQIHLAEDEYPRSMIIKDLIASRMRNLIGKHIKPTRRAHF